MQCGWGLGADDGAVGVQDVLVASQMVSIEVDDSAGCFGGAIVGM